MALVSLLGGSASNSYASVAEADAYAANVWWGATWLALDTSAKEIALIGSTSALETIPWAGTRCSPSTDDENLPQALSWPRSGVTCDGITATCAFIPADVLRATYELAYQLSVSPGALQPGAPSGGAEGTYVSKQQLGDLVQEFSAFPSGTTASDCTNCSDPEVITKFPWIKDYLKCWSDLTSGSGRVLLRVRS